MMRPVADDPGKNKSIVAMDEDAAVTVRMRGRDASANKPALNSLCS